MTNELFIQSPTREIYEQNQQDIHEDSLVFIEDTKEIIAKGTSYKTLPDDVNITSYFDNADYDKELKRLRFYNNGEVKATIDATPFIVDNFVDEVKVEGNNLVVTFNTENKAPIKVPITDIFNADNYYSKTLSDSNFVKKSGDTMSGNLEIIKNTQGSPGSIAGISMCTMNDNKSKYAGIYAIAEAEYSNRTGISFYTGAAISAEGYREKMVLHYNGSLDIKAEQGTAPLSVTSSTKVDNLNADMVDGLHKEDFLPRIAYNYENGFLIKLNISETANSMVIVKVIGNGYYGGLPIDTTIQLYNYDDEDRIIASEAVNNGFNIKEIKVFIYQGLLHIWFKQAVNYQSISVSAFNSISLTEYRNIVVSIENKAMPTEGITRLVTITPKSSAFTDSTVANAKKVGGYSADNLMIIKYDSSETVNTALSAGVHRINKEEGLPKGGKIYGNLLTLTGDNYKESSTAYQIYTNHNSGKMWGRGLRYDEGNIVELGNWKEIAFVEDITAIVQQASVQSFSTLVQVEPATTQSTRMRAKSQPTMIVEAGKQYYNDEENKVISEYKGFTATNQEAKILSKYPMTFAGENVIVENNDIIADYLMYTLKYMQISEDKYFIAVSVSTFTSNGGDGFDVEKPIDMPEEEVEITDMNPTNHNS